MSSPVVFVPPTFSITDANEFASRLRRDQRGFTRLAEMLQRICGIHLPNSEKNLSLMAGRLAPLLRDSGLDGYESYANRLATGDQRLIQEFVNALTTNTTEFFREATHFDYLTKIAPEIYRRKGEIRVWCAASSTGQEAWTILMTLREAIPTPGPLAVKMLATDIDMEVLERAASGWYTEDELRGVPPMYRQRYFTSQRGAKGRSWRVSPQLAACVTFAPFNLTSRSYSFKQPFDVVFCRNVLIYFDRAMVAQVLERLVGTLAPGGHLFLGHSESGTLRNSAVNSVAAAVYKRRD